ncbi:cytosolic Fe-S cluster assembly factor cfd1 [Malassezia vespertilionis]|uniref:Cfd1p n=1 Tax=Malassezia vespertilionis TaxID=2020962 RepID=A0A2N1J7U6_9BASI|nr:cytosolic Fe-S cluster assembly factor cfd1 [Malassezia vespertilionis]PKI82624.1 Cfd1p [Malassezia vespertilionis]WFD08467.1 cytosolic Fe-S cluster assembly factor cfd1 [Malassezia vespertilionis]
MESIERRLRRVKHIVLVLSGKGGVGKSSVAAQLALSLSYGVDGYEDAEGGNRMRVGILDIDLTGPSIPRMLGVADEEVRQSTDGWVPVYTDSTKCLAVMSVGFLLRSKNDSVIWRGPKKQGMIRQFLGDVRWGDLDYLIIDTPPGTSDEHISLMEAIHAFGPVAVMVTTPQAVALNDNLRSLDFSRKVGLPVMGIIENMSGYVCPHCSDCTNVWGKGGGESLAEREHISFLGRIPIDPALVRVLDDALEDAAELQKKMQSGDEAEPLAGTALSYATAQRYRRSQTFAIFQQITEKVLKYTQGHEHTQ